MCSLDFLDTCIFDKHEITIDVLLHIWLENWFYHSFIHKNKE